MFNKKLKYYRKKNMMSQEMLAEHLNVSRQMITKWESGLSLPSCEYLIDLSKLFGITIDHLVKTDDCHTIEETTIDYKSLRQFLVNAKRNTYALKQGKIKSSRLSSHDYFYQDGKYCYLDSFVGASYFSGEEIVYEDEKPIWSMNYYGKVIGENFQGDFLKEALLKVSLEKPYRGPECYHRGDFIYVNSVTGSIQCFHGKEDIFYQDIKIYEGYYHGGLIK